MGWKIARGLAAFAVGVNLAFAGVVGVELLSSVLHPAPPGFNPADLDACRAHVARYPQGVLLLCAAGWWATVFVSCWVATRLGPNRPRALGMSIGLLFLAAATFNIAMLPYPGWFWINLLAIPAACLAGTGLARRTTSPSPA